MARHALRRCARRCCCCGCRNPNPCRAQRGSAPLQQGFSCTQSLRVHPTQSMRPQKKVAIPISYNAGTSMCEEDWSPPTFAARFYWRVLHEQHVTAGMTGMKPLWAFVSETWKQHGIDPSNADAVRGIINRSYALDNVRVVVCADEFSKPYGMLKERCQELYPGFAWKAEGVAHYPLVLAGSQFSEKKRRTVHVVVR